MAALCASLAGGIAQAASFTYSEQRKQIRAGVLVLSSARPQWDTFVNPYAFHVMNQRHDVKPTGWDFYNPLAPTHVTQQVLARWSPVAGGGPYKLGQAVNKDMGCYWEVFLAQATPDDIAQFDVLLLPGKGVPDPLTGLGGLQFTLEEREKLRKFVDNGGVLWIENLWDAQFRTGDHVFFIENLQFGGTVDGPISVPQSARAHSLLNRPFVLTLPHVNRLGLLRLDLSPDDQVRTVTSGTVGPPDGRYFTSILVAGGAPVVSIASYGSGHVVVVAESVSAGITEPVGVIGIPGGFCDSRFMFAQPEDLAFAYNIVSLGSQHATFQKAPRRQGYSFAEIGAPLATLWEYRVPPGSEAPTASAPAMLDEILFYVDGMGVLHALEMSPWDDRDGDGNPDDGMVDPAGAPYDELWIYDDLGDRASAPTAAYVPISGGAALPVVFVAVESGQVVAINALTGNKIEDVFAQSTNAFEGDVEIPAPAYVDGTVFLGDGAGFLHAKNYFLADPTNPAGNLEWTHPMTPTPAGAAYSPTVGYYYDPASGTTEQIVYLAKRGVTGVSPAQGVISCYRIAVFNETLKREGATGLMRTRARPAPVLADTGTWDLFYIDSTLGPQLVTGAVTPNPAGEPGSFEIEVGYFNSTIGGARVVGDYQVDYTVPNVQLKPAIGVKHNPVVPDYAGIACAPATSKKDILYFASENGSLYAVKDTTRGGSMVYKWRWYLKDPGAQSALGVSDAVVPFGSPAVADDMVYFAVNDGPQGMILAFKADPVFCVYLPKPVEPGGQVKVMQIDAMNPAPVPFELGGQGSAYVVDYDAGKVTFQNFKNGSNELSAAQDLQLEYQPVDSDQLDIAPPVFAFEPAEGEKWNNLVWFTKLRDPAGAPVKITSSPMVMGDILYVGCERGLLVSMDVVRIGRGKTGPPNLEVDWALAMAEGKAWAEPVMGAMHPILAAMGGSHGMLAVSTAEGVSVFYNPATLIADGERLVEMDVGGNVVWSCDSTVELATTSAPVGGLTKPVLGSVKVPFNRPAVARRAEVGGIIVADTGNNRVVHIDSGGNVLWQITTFEDPEPNQLLPAGSPLSLNRPRDVSMWVRDESVDPSDADAPTFPAYHYLIADSGNYRVLDVVAKYDPATGGYRNVLGWTSKTLEEGKRYEYVSARTVYDAATGGPAFVCVVTNKVSDANGIFPGGALIKITGIGTGTETYTVCRGDDADLAVKAERPIFFSRCYTSPTTYTDVALEPDKVHVVVYDVNPSTGAAIPNPLPVFTAKDYWDSPLDPSDPNPCRLPLAAAYAQVLPNGNVLVTNKATVGTGMFKGEIFEIHYDQATNAWTVGARVGVETPNSHGVRQPSSAER